jgi:hypothetical protein
VDALLDEHIEHVGNRIRELKSLQKTLKALRGLCQHAQATKNRRILQSLGSPAESLLQSFLDYESAMPFISEIHFRDQRCT